MAIRTVSKTVTCESGFVGSTPTPSANMRILIIIFIIVSTLLLTRTKIYWFTQQEWTICNYFGIWNPFLKIKFVLSGNCETKAN